MNRRHLILAAMALAIAGGCKRKQEPNKFIDPQPITSVSTCVPAQITQGWFFLKRDLLRVLVSVTNRSILLSTTYPANYPELDRLGTGNYRFQTSERHYGQAVFTVQYLDANSVAIDPINDKASTATIKSVDISVSITGSNLFTGNETLSLTFENADTVGIPDSTKRLRGTSTFNGSSYTPITFTIGSAGARGEFEGLVDGKVTAAGNGPGGAPATLTMDFFSDHTGSGQVQWEDSQGGIHIGENGSGYVITNMYRLLLE